MNRRHFLKSTASLSLGGLSIPGLGGSLLIPSLARAVVPTSARYFVLIKASGGWDVTLSLDPKTHRDHGTTENDVFIEYREDEILRAQDLKLGPAARPLLSFAEAREIAVINGVLMSPTDNGHDAGLSYITTGNGQSRAPSLPVEIALSTQAGPYGVISSSTNVNVLNRVVDVNSTTDIANVKTSVDISAFSSFLSAMAPGREFKNSQASLVENSEILRDLRTYLSELDPVISRGGTEREQALLAAAFLSGAAFQAEMSIFSNGNFDTHSGHAGQHMAAQSDFWSKISSLFSYFKSLPFGATGESLFDRTTFMIVSEFSRTPALNSNQGKDHNPKTNSVVLAGAGIQGGRSFGHSRVIRVAADGTIPSQHVGLPVQWQTGRPAMTRAQAEGPDYSLVVPENVIATVARAMNADTSRFQSIPQSTAPIAALLKS